MNSLYFFRKKIEHYNESIIDMIEKRDLFQSTLNNADSIIEIVNSVLINKNIPIPEFNIHKDYNSDPSGYYLTFNIDNSYVSINNIIENIKKIDPELHIEFTNSMYYNISIKL